jgi:adenylate cyclase
LALTLEQKRKLQNAKTLLLAGGLLGLVYAFFSDGFRAFYPYLNTLIIGLLIAAIISFFELFLFTGKIRKRSFRTLLLLRAGLYTLTVVGSILLVLIVSRMFRFDLNFVAVLRSAEFQNYLWYEDFLAGSLYALGAVTTAIFVLQVRRRIGPRILKGFITGRYYQPREVERIILFIDIPHGEAVIERIGRIAYFQFLNDILFDITEVILHREADIYEYVDSNILLTWDLERGTKDANCVRCFFDMQQEIAARKIAYFEKYGSIPEFRGALHYGSVIRGEIGDVKSQVKYHGDVMNTAARMLGETSAEHPFLISADLLRHLELPVLYRSEPLGAFALRGKRQTVDLYAVLENEKLA